MKIIISAVICLVFTFNCLHSIASDLTSMPEEDNYSVCVACHGANGEGNKALNAPGIANLEADYLQQQLINFKLGIRGTHANDVNGAQMRAFVVNMDDSAINALAESIAALEDYEPAITLTGDANLGKDYYHQCGACHGVAAKGNQSLNAPKLAGLDDWYVLAQLNNFRQGVRGSHKQDKLGAQMHFVMQQYPQSQQLIDIISYLRKPQDSE